MFLKPKIAISGSTGLIGSAVTEHLSTKPYQLIRLIRPSTRIQIKGENILVWDPEKEAVDPSRLENLFAFIHLTGENISRSRWTAEVKQRIRASRVRSTRFLVDTLLKLDSPPEVVLSASAIGYYSGSQFGKIDETTAKGSGFLSDVCFEWEQALQPLTERGVRVIIMRFGVVLSGQGGALAKMLPIFRLGLGGPLGKGEQMMSWITREEIPFIVEHFLRQPQCRGPFNIVAPQPVSNMLMTRTLSRILSRPAVLPIPLFLIKKTFGEMGEELLLNNLEVYPKRLVESGYTYRFPDLSSALKAALK